MNRSPVAWRAALRARYAALPPEHGAWVFLLVPLVIGLAAGGLRPASALLVIAALAAFLIRQPITLAVKALSGRRPRSELPIAAFWLVVYALVGLPALLGLVALGDAFLVWLALPAAPVFAWHLWLVSRRAERRQMWVEMVAAGVLALAAPAALWVGRGQVDPRGWLLWGLCWLQVAGAILHAYLRLEQRPLKRPPRVAESLALGGGVGWAALLYNLAALALVAGLAWAGIIPAGLVGAYLVQPLEVLWGLWRPASGMKPQVIGIRQGLVSLVFMVVFIWGWSGF